MEITSDNYHVASRAIFTQVADEDLTALLREHGKAGTNFTYKNQQFNYNYRSYNAFFGNESTYFTTIENDQETIYRASDHWSSEISSNKSFTNTKNCGFIRSCYWILSVSISTNSRFVVGRATFSDMTDSTNDQSFLKTNRAKEEIVRDLKQAKLRHAQTARRAEQAVRTQEIIDTAKAEIPKLKRQVKGKFYQHLQVVEVLKVLKTGVVTTSGKYPYLSSDTFVFDNETVCKSNLYGRLAGISSIRCQDIDGHIIKNILPAGTPLIVLTVSDKVKRQGSGKYRGAEWVEEKSREVLVHPKMAKQIIKNHINRNPHKAINPTSPQDLGELNYGYDLILHASR